MDATTEAPAKTTEVNLPALLKVLREHGVTKFASKDLLIELASTVPVAEPEESKQLELPLRDHERGFTPRRS
jgi:hypothetical protein